MVALSLASFWLADELYLKPTGCDFIEMLQTIWPRLTALRLVVLVIHSSPDRGMILTVLLISAATRIIP